MAPDQTVLAFHGLGTAPAGTRPEDEPYWVAEDTYLEILDRIAKRTDIVITFDDGLATDASVALPALTARGLSGSFFILAGKFETPGYLDRDDARALHDAGMRVGLHGMDHVPWTQLDASGLKREVEEARDVLSALVGAPVRHAACPFGAYDRGVIEHLDQAGFERVYTSDGGRSHTRDWLVARTTITKSTDLDALFQLIEHGESPLRTVFRLAKRSLKRRRRARPIETPSSSTAS